MDRMTKWTFLIAAIVACWAFGCSSDTKEEDAGPDASDDADTDTETDADETPPDDAGGDADEDIEEEYLPLCQTLAAAGIEEPVIGLEIPDTSDFVWGEGELVWEARKIAVIDAEVRSEAAGKPAAGWRVFVLEELGDPTTLFEALGDGGGE